MIEIRRGEIRTQHWRVFKTLGSAGWPTRPKYVKEMEVGEGIEPSLIPHLGKLKV